MMQITKTLHDIRRSRDKARDLAKEGKREQSDDYIMEAYANAIYLYENYGAAYFTDEEYEFITNVINEIEA